ncbi:MAG: hypothetical protein Q4F21_07715 [Lachnospiraceae bacterium]|nr:hypothetical protein [Lachnospiraceae bacterium]
MNWIQILIEIFAAILMTSITGTVMLLIWRFCQKRVKRWSPLLVYRSLKLVSLFFVIPFAYLGVLVYRTWQIETYKMLNSRYCFDETGFIMRGMAVLAVIWGISIILILYFRIRQRRYLKRLRFFNEACDRNDYDRNS